MRASWAGPCYEVGEPVGQRAQGALWHAVELATGVPVVLRRLPPATDVAEVRRSAALLRTLPTVYLLQVRSVLEVEDRVVVVTGLAAAGTVARLLGRRGRLDPGEVATVASALAQALAALHGRGLVHGALTPERLLLSGRGMPLLTTGLAAGLAPTRSRTAAADATSAMPSDDVASMAGLCRQLLTGRPDAAGPAQLLAWEPPSSRLVELLDAVLAAPPGARPTAAELERQVRAVQEPARIRLTCAGDPAEVGAEPEAAAPVPTALACAAPVGAGPVGATPASAGRGSAGPASAGAHARPPVRRLVAISVLALGAGGLAWLSGRSTGDPAVASVLPGPAAGARTPPSASGSSPAAGPTGDVWSLPPNAPISPLAEAGAPSPTSPPPRQPVTALAWGGLPPSPRSSAWRSLVVVLEAARDRALGGASAPGLMLADAPGSGLLAADRAVVTALRGAGESAPGLRHGVRSVGVVRGDGQVELLVVVDDLAAYDIVDRTGRPVEHRPARAAETFEVTVVRTAQGYRLQRVTRP